MADVAGFRKTFLAFWRGRYNTLSLPSTSTVAPQKGGRSYSQPGGRNVNRLECISALGYVMAHNYRAYAVACAYDFEGGSRHPAKWAKSFRISESTLHRLVGEFWKLLYEHLDGRVPGEEM